MARLVLTIAIVLAVFKTCALHGDWQVLTETEYPKLVDYLMELKYPGSDENMFNRITVILEAEYQKAKKGLMKFKVKFYGISDLEGYVHCKMILHVGVGPHTKPAILEEHCEPLWEEI